MKLGYFSLLFLLTPIVLFSQQFTNLTVDDGLSSNHVFCIHQDHLGFMWFGTMRGLNRYDGVSIRAFTHDPADTNSLSNDEIKRIYEDENHILWIGTIKGLNRFDPKTEQFTRYYFGQDGGAPIMRILAEGDTILWLGTMYDLIRFRKKTGEYDSFLWRDENGDMRPEKRASYALARLDNGCLAVSCGLDDFHMFDPTTRQFSELHDTFAAKRMSSGYAAFCDSEGLVWFGFSGINGVYCLDQKTWKLKGYLNSVDSTFVNYPLVIGITEDHDGYIWFATLGGGLTRHDKKTKSFVHYTPQIGVTGRISTNQTCDVFVDQQGNIWCGSYDGGVNMLPRWGKNIRLHEQYPEKEKSIGYGAVDDLCQDLDGNLWVVNSGGGVTKISPDFLKATHMCYTDQAPFRNLWEYQAVERVRRGDLWFCGNRVSVLDWQTKSISFLTGPDITNPGKIWPRSAWICMSEDSLGNMWFGSTYEGLLRYDREKKIKVFQYDPNDSTSLSGNAVFSLMCDKGGHIWAGTGAGLSCLPQGTESFINYTLCDSSPSGGAYGVFGTFEDSRGLLWMGCGYGLYVLDRTNGCFVDRTADLGIAKQDIRAILEDKNGHLWLRTTTHLFRYDVENRIAKSFGPEDGFVGVNTSQWRMRDFCTGRTGHIYYGGTRIVGRFHPDSLFENPDPPPIVLTDLEVNYKRIRPGDEPFFNAALPYVDELKLPYDHNIFSIAFAALDYTAPQKNEYAYKLAGLHKEWVAAGARHVATFTRLSPGRYTFHVKAANNDGIWNEMGASLKIRILPPWWRTTWAYLLWSSLLFGVVYAAYRLQLNRARLKQRVVMEHEQSEKLHELDRLKSSFFANISHELRTPLTLILGPLENIIKLQIGDYAKTQIDIMQRNGARLLQLINQLLDFAKIEAGTVHLAVAEMDIIPFVKRIVASFMSAAERKNMALDFKADERVLLCYFDADKLEKVVANLLANAFKFTPQNGHILVRVRRQENDVIISVRDSGIGIPAEQLSRIFDRFHQVDCSQTRKTEGAGIGLALAREMIELHHGSIEVQSELGHGSEFIVRLPLGRAHFKDADIVKGAINESIFEPSPVQPVYAEEIPESATRRGKPLVLIVEDNRDVRYYIRDLLSDGYNIREAEDGLHGLEAAIRKMPDLIISDVMMPEMDGYELCKRIKTDERTSHIPVILLTARAAEADKLVGLETGADDYIVKPFSAQELYIRVKNLIMQRRKLREKFSRKLSVDPSEVTVTSIDTQFLKRAIELVEEHMAQPDFGSDYLARHIGLSRMQLFRKIKALTDLSTSQFVLVIRLKRAAQLLKEKAGTVTEIAYQVGFQNPSYFSACFRRQFGVLPSEYLSSY
ncbi:response regulator [candidate division KSB1 bacterium]|nr:response regulator [candidate division KSB1 bacterium]